MTHATRPVAFVLCALMLCALMLSIAPTAAQKITIDEVMKPYDATTRAEPVPPSSGQMDRQLVVPVRGVLGVLGVLIIGSAIYWFRRRSAQRKQIERGRDFQIEREGRANKHWRIFWIVLAAIILLCVAVDFGPLVVGCGIKGNISTRTGERIYHVPGQQYYLRTRVNWLRGERWFCSESAAQSAGWRKSRV